MKKILDQATYLDALIALSDANKCGSKPPFCIETPYSRQGLISFVINSRILPQSMLVEVSLPAKYDRSLKDVRYPVMYMLDSIKHIELFDNTNIISTPDENSKSGRVKEIITVGIDFIGSEDCVKEFSLAYHTPAETKAEMHGTNGGYADLFIQFIEMEVKPLIHEKFNTDKYNETLAGHLYGGLFTLYTLISQPELFENYIASSPILSWGNNAICRFEKNYSMANRTLSKNVYISMGSMEFMFQDVTKNAECFAEKLNNRNYKGLRMLREVHQDENHDSAVVRSYAKGARFVFNND